METTRNWNGKEKVDDEQYHRRIKDTITNLVRLFSSNHQILLKMYSDFMNEKKFVEAFEVCIWVLKRDDLRIDFNNPKWIEWNERLYEVRERLFEKYYNENDIYNWIKICTFSIEYEAKLSSKYWNCFTNEIDKWIERLIKLRELENRI